MIRLLDHIFTLKVDQKCFIVKYFWSLKSDSFVGKSPSNEMKR